MAEFGPIADAGHAGRADGIACYVGFFDRSAAVGTCSRRGSKGSSATAAVLALGVMALWPGDGDDCAAMTAEAGAAFTARSIIGAITGGAGDK